VTALGSGAPDWETTTDRAPRRGFGPQILAVLLGGLIFRLILAYGLPGLRGSGFDTDLTLFRYWADVLAQYGPWGFYANASYADYTPGYLYALWPVGLLGQAIGGVGDLIKIPPIITDVVMGYLVYAMAKELGVSGRRSLIAAAVVVFNPVTWFDSVIWGQVDSFGTVFLLLAVRQLWRGNSERSAILAVCAALVKPQLAILVPIVALVVIRRALWPAGGWGNEEAPTTRGFAWERRTTGPVRIVTTAVAGFVTAVLLCAPFGLTVIWPSSSAPFVDSSLLRLVLGTAGQYPYLTVNAYNAWALFPVDGVSMASGGGWLYDSPVKDAVAWGTIGPLNAATFGAVLLLGVAGAVAWAVARRPDRLTILVGTCVLAFAFFAAPTRVHERYLFPLFGLAGILIAFSWRWRIAYVAASTATFLNMYVVLTTLYGDKNPRVSDWLGIGELIRSPLGITVVALLHTGAFVWALLQLRPRGRRTLVAELDDGRRDEDEAATTLVPRRHAVAHAHPADPLGPIVAGAAATGITGGTGGSGITGSAGVAPSASRSSGRSAVVAQPAVLPAWYDRPSWTELGPIGWFRARLTETPIRGDRSSKIRRERHGRLDRMDLFILVVLVVASLGLRMFRLSEPARMHFDEVYHARTATEFLQDWRYGISHNIYEWTHPHLAKYLMAGGIVLFAGQDVAASSDLGVPVRDAAVEPRRDDPVDPGNRAGDRVWVATGSELLAYDLQTRVVEARWALPGASSVAYDEAGAELVVGTDTGDVLTVDTTSLDSDRGANPDVPAADLVPVTTLDGPVRHLAAYDDGTHVAALLDGGVISVLDLAASAESGLPAESGRATVDGAVAMASIGNSDGVVATLADVTDPAAAAAQLFAALGGDAAAYEEQLRQTGTDTVVINATLSTEGRTALQKVIDDGTLTGIAIGPVPTMAVAGASGVTFISANGAVSASVDLPAPATGLAHISGVDEGTQLYVTTKDDAGQPEVSVIAVSGDKAKNGPQEDSSFALPAAGTTVLFDAATEMVEILGQTPDGTGTTVYVVEPHGKSVFADHELSFVPSALVMDHNEKFPGISRGAVLAFSDAGRAATLDVGHYAFAWRLPGVIFGALTAGVLYLLGRILFRRRMVGVLVGLFVLLDGLFFVQSRIAMNDVYTGFFILAAYLGFAWLWVVPRPRWQFWALMPVIGVLLGLALASKWVAAYAIGALGILYLARSALGRILLIAGMIAVTGVLGWMALAVPLNSDGAGNLPFVLIMIGLTLGTVVVTVYHPVAWSDDEVRFAVGAPAAVGILVALTSIALGKAETAIALGPVQVTPLHVGFAGVALGIVAYGAFMLGGKLGIGPLAPPEPDGATGPPPASPAPDGWLRMGWGLGIPVAWFAGCLLVLPLIVYVISYLPWAAIDNHQLVTGWPVGHTGQTLLTLIGDMYRYHNDLTAAHAASSPWWAWPLNLKPVWFYQGSYAGGTAGSIYDAGNLVIWWLGIPAMAFVAYQAFKRRSLPLALILVGFLCQWISWARIDRAAFQYHYYTSLPFVVMALAYFVAEVWHGPSRRIWLLARWSAAVALVGPLLLWLLRYPLCSLANVEAVNKGSQACHGNPGNLVVTPATAALLVIAIITVVALVKLLVDLGRPRADGTSLTARDLAPLGVTALVGLGALLVSRMLPDADPLFTMNGVVPELIALIAAIPLGLVAIQVVTARDARRFTAGLVAATATWFVILYPNISALPMPAAVVNAYQGLLPTYLYAFQFGVNTVDRSGAISFSDPRFAVLMVVLVIACAVVAYSAWAWRQALAPAPPDCGEDGDHPSSGEGHGGPGAAPSLDERLYGAVTLDSQPPSGAQRTPGA